MRTTINLKPPGSALFADLKKFLIKYAAVKLSTNLNVAVFEENFSNF